jgi:hypothetical protein
VISFAWVHTANSLLVSVARVKATEYVKDGKLRTSYAPNNKIQRAEVEMGLQLTKLPSAADLERWKDQLKP